MNGEYTIIKQTLNSNNLKKKTFTMDLGHELTAILNLSDYASGIEGGGIEFHG